MAKFLITYPTGAVEEEVVPDIDVEGYINRKFGSVDPKEHGVTIELVELNESDKAFVEEASGTTPAETAQVHHILSADTLDITAELNNTDGT